MWAPNRPPYLIVQAQVLLFAYCSVVTVQNMNNKPGPYRSDALDVGQAGDVVRCERWRAEWYCVAADDGRLHVPLRLRYVNYA